MMLEAINRFWTAGSEAQPPSLVRQITLTNQISVLASIATTPYQAFYLFYDPVYYLPLLVLNSGFIALYLLGTWINRRGRFDLARNVVFGSIYLHLLLVTYFVSNAIGVHLFYFTLGGSLGLIFAIRREPRILLLLGLAAVLFAICHFVFIPGSTPFEIPEEVAQLMYIWSSTGAVFLAGGFSLLFRLEIDKAEAALTRSNEELERLSSLDGLTGLPNRRTLDDFLARELARGCRTGDPISVLLSDVDFFKPYNDYYGHIAGDECLRRVAAAFAESARRGGDLAARFGGEEFVIVLTSTDPDGALEVAERLRTSVMELNLPHERSPVEPVVTISVGVVTADPNAVEGSADLLHRADEALYRAKKGGRNRVASWAPAKGATRLIG